MLSSQRQDEVESQPFFKPTTQNQNASNSFFIFGDKETSRSTATSIFQDSSPQPQQISTARPSLLITPSLCPSAATVSNMQERQYQQQQMQKQQEPSGLLDSSDRLSKLHTRLHKEADKIRSWKVQTEMDLKQRERKLQDAQITIESQKKSILELQLQNENLSRKLKEEMDNRTDISERIESTRDMCNLLKDYTTKLQDRMAMCESDRDELKTMEKQNIEDLEELGVMFKDLSLLHTNKVNDLMLALNNEKDSSLKNSEQLISQTREIQLKLKDLERQLDEKEVSIQQMLVKKQEIEQHLAELEKENSSLQKTLAEAVDKVQTQAAVLEQSEKQITDLNHRQEELISEKVQLQEDLQSHSNHIEELEQNVQSLTECIEKLTSEKDTLFLETQTLRENLAIKLGEIDGLKDELKVVLEREQASYEKVDSVKQQNQAEREENVILSESLKTAEAESKSLEGKLLIKEEQMQELRKNLETLQETAKEGKTMLEASGQKTKDLEEEINILRETHTERELNTAQELHEVKIKNENLNRELEAISNQSISLESKNKSLHGQVTSKTKQVKDLQQELKTLKGKLTAQTKLATAAEEKFSSVSKELEDTKSALEEMKAKLHSATEDMEHEKDVLKDLRTKLLKKEQEVEEKIDIVENLEDQAVSLRQKTEAAVKEHTDAKQACELQMAEVSATLDKYKAENERMVAQKEKEIDQLKKEMEQQKYKKKLEEDQISQMKKDLQGLKHQLAEVQAERDEAKKQVSNQEENIHSLKEKLKGKEDELNQLLTTAESLGEPMAGISPIAPKQITSLPKHSTPKPTPKQVAPQTPTSLMAEKPLPLTPCKSKNPRHSILKHAVSATRKRHVAFASDDEDSFDGSVSDSSSSQLMEIEQSEVDRRLNTTPCARPSQKVQPLHVTPSKRNPSSGQSTPDMSAKMTPLKPGSGGRQTPSKSRPYLKPKKMKPQEEVPSEMTQAELIRFKELYPDETAMHPTNKVKAKKTLLTTGNTRKTSNRIFKVKGLQDSFKGHKTKSKAGKPKENDLSWLDMDAVYGFFE